MESILLDVMSHSRMRMYWLSLCLKTWKMVQTPKKKTLLLLGCLIASIASDRFRRMVMVLFFLSHKNLHFHPNHSCEIKMTQPLAITRKIPCFSHHHRNVIQVLFFYLKLNHLYEDVRCKLSTVV